MNYQTVIDLGFEREQMEDDVLFKQNGYQWFLVTKKLTKRIIAEWSCESKTVQLVRYDKKDNVLGRLDVNSVYELEKYIEFFSNP